MNALVLWIPGTLLVMVGTVLLVLGRLELTLALVVIGLGIALETVGTVLWIRQRKPSGSPGASRATGGTR